MSAAAIERLDEFDQLQLSAVIRVCRECHSLSEAGRRLFAVSREARSSVNDADRLRKFLARFGLAWVDLGEVRAVVRKVPGNSGVSPSLSMAAPFSEPGRELL